MKIFKLLGMTILLSTSESSMTVASDFSFQGLGLLSKYSSAFSGANGVSADGSVIVGTSGNNEAGSVQQAFRWTRAAGMVGLGYINNAGSNSGSADVSSDGSIVVGQSTWHPVATSPQAF